MWWPTAGVCFGIFQNDGVNRGEVETIVDSFPGQSIDFFGAMRARVYDDKVGHAEARDCALLCSVRGVHLLFSLLVYLWCPRASHLLRAACCNTHTSVAAYP